MLFIFEYVVSCYVNSYIEIVSDSFSIHQLLLAKKRDVAISSLPPN